MTAKKKAPALGGTAPNTSKEQSRNTSPAQANAPKGAASVSLLTRPMQSPGPDRVAAAAVLIAQGWSVFPLLPCTKDPFGLLAPHGFKNATQDLALVAQWFAEHPAANLGAVPPEGCYVLDVDTYKDEERLRPLEQRLASLHTPLQRSGGGGTHFLLRGPAPSQTDLRKRYGVPTGIEVKAHGKGYIVVEPSVHDKTGAIYQWAEPPVMKPADTPAWLLEGLAAQAPDRDDDQPAPMPKASIGIDLDAARDVLVNLPMRWVDDYFDWLAAGMALHHEFRGGEDALALWDEWSQRSPRFEDGVCAAKWQTFGKPGKEGEEVTMRTLVREASTTGWRSPAAMARAVLDFRSGDWLDNARAERFDLSQPPPPADWLFEGTIRNAKLTILAGAGGSSKSFFALALAAHWAAGVAFDAFVPTCRDTADEVLLLYAEEDELDLHHRYLATMAASAFDVAQQQRVGKRLLLRSLFDLEGDTVLARYEQRGRAMQRGPLLDLLEQTLDARPTLRWVLMDPLVLLHQLDENDNRSMAQLAGELGALARKHRVAIWLVHHLSKSGAQADDSTSQQVRGASAIVDNARGLVLLRRLTSQDASALGVPPHQARQMVRLSLPKHNHSGPLPDRYFFVDEDTGAVRPMGLQPLEVPAAVRRALKSAAVREQAAEAVEKLCLTAMLQALDRSPLGTNEIYAARPGGRSRKVVEPVLATAIEDGLVEATTGLRGKKMHRLTDAGSRKLEELGIEVEDLLSAK